MSINFNELPSEKPSNGAIIPTGQYKAKITKAEMKQPQDPTKALYLNIEMDITDLVSSMSMGKLWVILTESEANLPRYQLRRFIEALKLPIQDTFELKDLTKIIPNKELLVDITPEERKDGKPAQKSVVDISADMFYSLETAQPNDEVPDVLLAPEESTEPKQQTSY